jgi:hypothetical protein
VASASFVTCIILSRNWILRPSEKGRWHVFVCLDSFHCRKQSPIQTNSSSIKMPYWKTIGTPPRTRSRRYEQACRHQKRSTERSHYVIPLSHVVALTSCLSFSFLCTSSLPTCLCSQHQDQFFLSFCVLPGSTTGSFGGTIFVGLRVQCMARYLAPLPLGCS